MPTPSPTPGPFSPQQEATLDQAAERMRALLKSARVATVNAWTVGVFGALSVLWGLVSGGGGVVVGVALLAVSWNERRGRDRLRRLDAEGARILGWNQIILAAVVAAYCLAVIVRSQLDPDPSMREMEAAIGLSGSLLAEITALVYGGVIVVVGFVQAVLARYHFRRGPMVEAFRREVPAWAIEVLTRASRGLG